MRRLPVPAVLLLLLAGCSENANPLAIDNALMGYGASTAEYEIQIIDLSPNGWFLAIGDNGDAIGKRYPHALYWSEETGAIDVMYPGAWGTDLSAIASDGTVAGIATFPSPEPPVPFLWSLSGDFTPVSMDIGELSWGPYPRGINSAGDMVGEAYDRFWNRVAWIRRADGTASRYEYPGSAYTVFTSIEENGLIAGYFADSSGDHHGFVLFPDGTTSVLNPPSGDSDFITVGANTSGFLVGYSWLDGTYGNHTATGQVGSAATIIRLEGEFYGGGQDVNDSGVVLATSSQPGWFTVSYLWSPSRWIRELPHLGGGMFARSINNSGQIVGWSNDSEGVQHHVLLNPLYTPPATPEDQMAEVIETLAELVQAGNLPANNAEALVNKVELAAKKLARNNPQGAIGSLQAAINQLHAFIHAGKLEEPLGLDLIAAIQNAINMIVAP